MHQTPCRIVFDASDTVQLECTNEHGFITGVQTTAASRNPWIKHAMVRQGLKEGTHLNARIFCNCSCRTNRPVLGGVGWWAERRQSGLADS